METGLGIHNATAWPVKYGLDTLCGDLFGGLTSPVVALPVSLAFGVASGLGAAAGLYGGAADQEGVPLLLQVVQEARFVHARDALATHRLEVGPAVRNLGIRGAQLPASRRFGRSYPYPVAA